MSSGRSRTRFGGLDGLVTGDRAVTRNSAPAPIGPIGVIGQVPVAVDLS